MEYACKKFHYSGCTPSGGKLGYNVYENNEYCGVIIFSRGANNNLAKPYGLVIGEVLELTRIALNGKQSNVSKPLSIALKLLKRDLPLVKLIVSFADDRQSHIGTIYQATNWYYTGSLKSTPEYYYKGKWRHQRYINSVLDTLKGFRGDKRDGGKRLRYIYPIDKKLTDMCKLLSKPYPKRLSSIDS